MVCDCTLKALGWAALAFLFYKVGRILFNVVYPYLIAAPKNLRELAGAKWAVVTGSTDGIGKAYAFELAKRGFNLVLISRTPKKLEDVANEIKEKHSDVQIKNIPFDFTNASLADYESTILSELNKLEVGVLINNVGMSYEYPDRLHKIDGGLKRIADITVINTVPTTVLTAAVLKQMSERNKGVVVNISSSAAYYPLTFWAIYTATKKYVTWISEVLRKEYADTGITIQTICPMMVATNMSKVKRASFFTPNPEQYAKAAIRTIGNVDETTGYLSHQIQASFLWNIPAILLEKLTSDNSVATRKRALKKKEASAKSE